MFNNDAINNPGGLPNALAANFHELNITGAYDWAAFDPMHVILSGDFVKNIGFDRAEILQRTGQDIQPKTTGYQAKVTVGVPDHHEKWRMAGVFWLPPSGA